MLQQNISKFPGLGLGKIKGGVKVSVRPLSEGPLTRRNILNPMSGFVIDPTKQDHRQGGGDGHFWRSGDVVKSLERDGEGNLLGDMTEEDAE